MRQFVTLVLHFVASDDILQLIFVEEAFCDIRAELNPDTPLARRSPHLGLRIGPEQLAHETCGNK